MAVGCAAAVIAFANDVEAEAVFDNDDDDVDDDVPVAPALGLAL